jgi:hypothetical protein
LNSPEKLLKAFADFVQRRHAATLYLYAGYTGLAGSLLVKVKDSDKRVAIRPWLRNRPVGLVDIIRSDKRYQSFRGQEPAIHIHIGGYFRDNAIHAARRSDTSSLIVFDAKRSAVGIIQSSNIPKPLLDALLAFCSESGLKTTYDFTGTLVHEGFKGKVAQAGRVAARARNPRLFLSYSWDSDAHRLWVLKLAADLIRNGVHVLVDEWDLRDYNDDLHLFMESGIRESDFVVLVCTPQYGRRANDRKGGVGVESTIITGEFYDPTKASKFVPVMRGNVRDSEKCLPSYLKSRYAINFTRDSAYQVKLEELLRRVFGQPRYRRPGLGPIPEFGSEDV